MPYSITADDEKMVIRTCYVGEVGVSDLRGAIGAVMSMIENADTAYRVLSDFTGVESWRATTKDLRELGRDLVPYGPSIRIERSALVAPQDSIFGDLRAWVSVTDMLPFNRAVFRDIDAALRWLETGRMDP